MSPAIRFKQDILDEIAVASPSSTVLVPLYLTIDSEMEQRAMSKNITLTRYTVDYPASPYPLTDRRAAEIKDTNPKDAIGVKKVSMSVLPFRVLWELCLAMFEGAAKYGRHNYRAAGVRASVYFDAAQRHLGSWWEGEDIDADSRLNHVTKAIATLVVLRDSMIQGNWVDDRPPGLPYSLASANEHTAALIEQHKDKNPRHWTIKDKLP